MENPVLERDIVPLREIIKKSVDEYKDNIALQMRRGKAFYNITYGELWEKINAIAKSLVKFGVKKGEKVGLIGPNRPEWAISYLAIHTAGGVVIPIDSKLKEKEVLNIIKISGLKRIITATDHFFMLHGLKSNQNLELEIISMDADEGVQNLDELIGIGKRSRIDVWKIPVRSDDDLSILFTSGTTGKSKGVILTSRNVVYDSIASLQRLHIYPEDAFISILPLHHTFEATAGFIIPLICGAKITYARSLRPNEIIEDIKDARITVMLGVPLLFEKIYNGIMNGIRKQPLGVKAFLYSTMGISSAIEKLTKRNSGKGLFKSLREKAGLGSLKVLISGGAALRPDIAKGFRMLGFNMIQGYGLTETSPIANLNTMEEGNITSVGKPIVGIEEKIVRANQEGIGEICIKGPLVMKGYYEDEERTDRVLKDGWFYTGDIGYFDRKGYLYIVGRQKNVIVTEAGKNIYPEEIEYELLKSPYIKEVVVKGYKNEKTGREEVKAIVYPNIENISFYEGFKGKEITGEIMKEINKIIKGEVMRLTNNLASYKKVKSVQLRLEEFEKTTSRKIKRYIVNRKQ
ncbi:MAG: AMP-binding protein [Proteobacteria bacterium]|nr:AMP-binding protein [Pseudomonadota bacterium]